MQVFLAAPEYTQIQSNTTRVLVQLSSGVAEVYEQHQDLIGKIDNDIVEIEANVDNKIEKLKFLIQDGVFIVSTKNTISTEAQATEKTGETGIYIYAKRLKEINSKMNFEEISKEYELKKEKYEKEEQRLKESQSNSNLEVTPSNSKFYLLEDELNFLKRLKEEYEIYRKTGSLN